MKKELTRLFSVLLAAVLVFGTLPVSAMGTDTADPPASAVNDTALGDQPTVASGGQSEEDAYHIFFLDCGRKYYSVDSIKRFIDNASAAGFNYIQLAVGNDGLRFLLDDMSLTVGKTTYGSDAVKTAIHSGNEAYYNFDTDELTETEMNNIIAYANKRGMGVIPCVNTPGHMDAILSAANSLTESNCAYNGSVRTIDVTNDTAVAFTKALLQKYITYFADKGCTLFNMGADEYANDKYTTGSMGFGQLQADGKYDRYVEYVNAVAEMIKDAGMKPMAFNDGIYFNNNTSSGTFDTDIIVCYWSSGWEGYTPMSASDLAAKGFQLINTHGDYYWVLGKSDWQCSAEKASGFDSHAFQGSTIEAPAGSMFCVWADDPGAETEAAVISKTAEAIAAFGKAMKQIKVTATGSATLAVGGATTLTASKEVIWSVDNMNVVSLAAADESEDAISLATVESAVTAKAVTVTALNNGTATITATDPSDDTNTATYTVTVQNAETKNVSLTVGGTKTETITGAASVTGTYDANVVTVTTETKESTGYQYVQQTTVEPGTYYLATEKTSSPTAVTLTIEQSGNGYYLKNASGNYVYPSSQNQGEIKTSQKGEVVDIAVNDGSFTVSRTSKNKTAYLTFDGSSLGGSTSETSIYLYKQEEMAAGENTTVTFTGVAAGETDVTVGNVTYHVTVSAENISEASSLTVEYWITNRRVTAGGATSKSIQASVAYGQDGAAIADLISKDGTVNSSTNVVFWKATRLDSNNKQTVDPDVDKTKSGTDFTYVRYYGGKWAYSSDQENWTEFGSSYQVVAYYMQITTVTDEVTTEVVDWGDERTTYSGSDFVLLDFAVKYNSGTRVPNSFPVSGKTVAYHCVDGALNKTVFKDSSNNKYRAIGQIDAIKSDEYEVYMITLTPSNDNNSSTYSVGSTAASTTSYTYDGTEKVIWVDKEENLPDEFADSTMHAEGYHVGGEAVVPGLKIYNKHAMLVTYYVREIPKETSLTVNYVDKSTNTQFYTYNINVAEGTTFNEYIGLATPWKGNLSNGSVVNIKNKTQYVTADLTNMSAVPASYRHSNYTCTNVVRSVDGKTVTLYYTFSNVASFVIDFGTPLTISATDLSENNQGSNITAVKVDQTGVTTGEVKVNSDKTITFTPTQAFAASVNGETFKVTLTGNQTFTDENGNQKITDGDVTYFVHVYPASNVLYEENFLSNTAEGTTWTQNGTAANKTQQTQKTGVKTEGISVFGYDSTYANSRTSNGVLSISGLSTDRLSAPLTTSFYGNTFDLIGDCGPTTGRVFLVVTKNGENGTHTTVVDVDTRYDDGTAATLHQVPLAHVIMTGEKYGTDDALCTVKIYAAGLDAIESTANTVMAASDMSVEADTDDLLAQVLADNGLSIEDVDYIATSAADTLAVAATPNATDLYNAALASDGTGESGYSAGNHVEIDGFRVYRSTDESDTVAKNYPADEQNVTYANILDVAEDSFVGFVDQQGDVSSATVETYESIGGPQNEIYLTQNHAVVFKNENLKNTTIQVSLRAVKDNTSVKVGNHTISSVTEMYYEITSDENGTFTVTNTGTGMLAIGNVKLPGTAQTSNFVQAADMDNAEIVNAIRYALYGAEEPDPEPEPDPETETFEPATFNVTDHVTNVIRNKVVTLKIKVSDDVAYVTVNGVKYTRTGLQSAFQKTRTIRVIKTLPKDAEKTYEIIAYNADGVASETVTKTVK